MEKIDKDVIKIVTKEITSCRYACPYFRQSRVVAQCLFTQFHVDIELDDTRKFPINCPLPNKEF